MTKPTAIKRNHSRKLKMSIKRSIVFSHQLRNWDLIKSILYFREVNRLRVSTRFKHVFVNIVECVCMLGFISDVPDKLASHITHNNPTPICLKAADDEDDSKTDFGIVCEKPKLYQLIVSPQNAAGYHFVSILNSSTGTFSVKKFNFHIFAYAYLKFEFDIYHFFSCIVI